MLGALDDPGVTENLVSLCDDRNVPASVHAAACEGLGARTTGPDAIVTALGRHQSFLQGTAAPPVGAHLDCRALSRAVREGEP
jgi:hypothetical protein